MSHLAYGGWACSTIGSQNFGVLTKRYDNSLFSSQLTKIKIVHKVLWPPLVVNLSIPGSIWWGTAYFVRNRGWTQLLSYLAILDELRASCDVERWLPIFGVKIEAWKHKMVHIFHFLPTSLVFEIVNPFSWMFNSISSDKSCLISLEH